MEISFNNDVAIVTGAGRGIGAAIAIALGASGARVAVNDINAGNAEKVAKLIRDAGGTAIATAGDVANKFQCVDVIETTRSEWGQLDILVNNAAVEPAVSILKMDEWDFQRCLDVNLKGTFFMSQLVGRVMVDENLDRGGGSIVNIGSTAGIHTPLVDRSAYCASKAGIIGFSKECAREFAQYKIRVNTVLPGIIDTPLIERLKEDPDKLAGWERSIPMGRLGEADEVAQLVLFLASPQASYITGSTFTVDGGRVMR